jgi:hypothetical protein
MRTARAAAGLLAPVMLPALLLAGCATGSQASGSPSVVTPGGMDGSTATSSPSSMTPAPSTPAPSDGTGTDGGATGATSSAAPSPSGLPANLTIALDATGSGQTRTWTLTCDPPGGDHPDPSAACAALEDAGGAAAFLPPRRNVACTEIYGGPQVAHVTGTVDGSSVNADFSRTNGCEIARWDALAPLLGSAGGV